MECEKHLTGYFKDGDRSIVFSSDEYSFELMTGEVKNDNTDQRATIKANDGFIVGKTFDGKSIAIYTNDSLNEVLGKYPIETEAFAVSDGDYDFSEIVGIRFVGGSLQHLNYFGGTYNKNYDGIISTELPNEKIEFDCKTDGYSFRVVISLFHLDSDQSVGKDIQYSVSILFRETRPLSTVFYHYFTMLRIVSFLTRRQNVGFDRIILIKECDYDYGDLNKEIDMSHDFARMYIKEAVQLTHNTQRDNITFDNLGASVGNLFQLFYQEYTDEKQDFLPESFYPKTDDGAFFVTTEMIKSTCAIIEYLTTEKERAKKEKAKKEKSENKKTEENSDLKALIAEVNCIIKKYRDAENSLTPSDCDYFSSQLKYWKEPLKAAIMAFFDKYKDEIQIVSRNFNYKLQYDEQKVKEYIDHRNNTTHALEGQIDGSVGIIQMIAVVAIYCTILERIGLTRQEIQELCKEKILHTGLYW